jgi:hypothetical protein
MEPHAPDPVNRYFYQPGIVARYILWRLAPIAAVAILCAASIPASAAAPCNDYDFHFDAEPSFLAASSFEVHGRLKTSVITIATAHRVEKWSLDDSAAEAFCSRMRQVMAIEQSNDKQIGLDGIHVRGELSTGSSPPYKFDFWSPNKEKQPRDFAIADAVFTLLESTTPSCELNEYLEWLATYFPFGLPARTIPGSPLIVRFYGNLWSHDEDALEPLLMSLPTDAAIVIDMTNFNGMGAELSSAFRDLASRNEQVKWLASPKLASQLRKLGIKPKTIEVKHEPQCLGPGTHFSRR